MKDETKALVGAPATLATALFLWIPAMLYSRNALEMEFPLVAALPFLLGLAGVTFLGLLLVSLAFRRARQRRAWLVCVTLISLLLWLQFMVIGWSYGALDGSPVRWSLLLDRMVMDALLWGIVLAVGIRYAKRVTPRTIWISAYFLLLIFLLNLGLALGKVEPEQLVRSEGLAIDEAKRFRFSTRGNVIVVVWDEFQANHALDLLEARPDLKARFEGFRFYRNVLGGYQSTSPSISYLLSGRMYDNSGPYGEFLARTFEEHSTPVVLRRDGYLADLVHTYPRTIHVSPKVQDNLVSDTGRLADDLRDSIKLIELGLFASSPYFAKGLFYRDGLWTLSERTAFLSENLRAPETGRRLDLDIELAGNRREHDLRTLVRLADEISLIDDRPLFKFFHFRGAHTPFNLDRRGERRPPGNTLAHYRELLEYKLYLMTRFLEILEEAGLYDDSLVVFAGDHGSGRSEDALAFDHPETGEALASNLKVKARATPFLAVKLPGRRGAPDVSDRPMTLGDVNELILAGGDGFTAERPPEFVRRYFHYRWQLGTREYFHELREFVVTDHAWLDGAWTPYHFHPEGFDASDCFFNVSHRREVVHRDTPQEARVEVGASVPIDAPASRRPLFVLIALERLPDSLHEDHVLRVRQDGRLLYEGTLRTLDHYQESVGVQVEPGGGPIELAFDSGLQGAAVSVEKILWIAYDACPEPGCRDEAGRIASRTER